MATEGSNGTVPNPNHDDGVNAAEDTAPSEDEHHNQEPTNYEVQTSAASSENFIVPASAVERAPNSLKCRCMPHGVYVIVPALLSMFAWFAHLSKNGCDYSSVAGPIVADITNNPLVPYIHVGLSHYREPTYNKDDGEWYVDETLPCQAYNTDVVDIDGVWTFAKITSFLSFVFGGGGALFICFSSCFVFRKETWRWAGYEMLMATLSGALSFTWFATSLCGENKCDMQYGAFVDIIACVSWALSVLFIFCHYPAEIKSPQAVNSIQPPPPAQFEMSDQSEARRAGAATDEHEII